MNDSSLAQQACSSTKPALTPEDLGFGPLFWAARDGVIVGDAVSNRILFWNPAAEEIYGFTADEIVGKPIDVLIPDEDKHNFSQMVRGLLSEEAFLPDPGTSFEFPSKHKSGQDIFVEFTISPLEIPGKLYAFALIRDCTERKRLEIERDALLANAQETVRKAEELAALKADLSALIAHELGSPLAAIGAMIDLLEHDGISADQRTQMLSTMRSETHLLQRLVEDIRAAASVERGEFAVHLEPTSVEALLGEAIVSARAQLANHDFSLGSVINTRVMADRERIGQVLRNLLGNAAKHTPAGSHVKLHATLSDERVHIYVADTGPGIHADDLIHIFTKFGRGRDATGRRTPGMGLGLFLSRQIVHEHGGELAVTSAIGNGTTFSFDLEEAP